MGTAFWLLVVFPDQMSLVEFKDDGVVPRCWVYQARPDTVGCKLGLKSFMQEGNVVARKHITLVCSRELVSAELEVSSMSLI